MAVNWSVGHLYCLRSTGINYLFPFILGHELHLIYKAELNLKHLMPVVAWWIHQPVTHAHPDTTAGYLSAVLALQGRVPGRNWGKNKESQRATYLPLTVPSELWELSMYLPHEIWKGCKSPENQLQYGRKKQSLTRFTNQLGNLQHGNRFLLITETYTCYCTVVAISYH